MVHYVTTESPRGFVFGTWCLLLTLCRPYTGLQALTRCFIPIVVFLETFYLHISIAPYLQGDLICNDPPKPAIPSGFPERQ